MIPYSMPLWTILVKCPVPTAPACTNPPSAGFSASKMGWAVSTCSGLPPTIRQYPSVRPHTPPLVPASMKPMRRPSRSLPRRTESCQLELPPSITTSPGCSRPANSVTTPSVGSPDGTMTHTTWRVEPLGQLGERRHLGGVAERVVPHHLVTGVPDAGRHVPAHLAEAHHPDPHEDLQQLVEPDATRPALAFVQREQIAVGLSLLQRREPVVLARYRNVAGGVAQHLHETPWLGPALVELAGGVEEAGGRAPGWWRRPAGRAGRPRRLDAGNRRAAMLSAPRSLGPGSTNAWMAR